MKTLNHFWSFSYYFHILNIEFRLDTLFLGISSQWCSIFFVYFKIFRMIPFFYFFLICSKILSCVNKLEIEFYVSRLNCIIYILFLYICTNFFLLVPMFVCLFAIHLKIHCFNEKWLINRLILLVIFLSLYFWILLFFFVIRWNECEFVNAVECYDEP